MARGPDGVTYAPDPSEADGLSPSELGFVLALEKIVDRSMDRHPRGDVFVYGVHQELSPRMIEALVRRYRQAGWGEAIIREGATGAYILVLRP